MVLKQNYALFLKVFSIWGIIVTSGLWHSKMIVYKSKWNDDRRNINKISIFVTLIPTEKTSNLLQMVYLGRRKKEPRCLRGSDNNSLAPRPGSLFLFSVSHFICSDDSCCQLLPFREAVALGTHLWALLSHLPQAETWWQLLCTI